MMFKSLTPEENNLINKVGYGRAPDVTYEQETAGSREAWERNLRYWRMLTAPPEE